MPKILVAGEILLFGTVGDAWYGDYFTAGDVVMALAEIGPAQDVTVRINSGGGIATEGAAIHAALAMHAGKVTISVEGIAASAASLIAMAGDDIAIRQGAILMIHDPSMVTWGNAADHAKSKESLDALGNAYAAIYAGQTGQTLEEARNDMREELWLTGEEAVSRGYADRFDAAAEEKPPVAFNYRLYAHAPQSILAFSAEPPKKKQRFGMKGALASLFSHTDRDVSRDRQKNQTIQPENPAQPSRTEPEMPDLTQDDLTKAVADANARTKAILSAPEAKGRENLATHLAFSSQMSVEEAIATLKASPAAASQTSIGLDTREMQHGVTPDADPALEAAHKEQAAITASWDKVADTLNAQRGFKH